jgi:hypothetical protein
MNMEFSERELLIINNALNEVLNGPDAIEEWEFGARIGTTREEARRLLDEIGKRKE